VSKGTDFVV